MKLPWLRMTWLQILQSFQQKRLPHAIGISCSPELGADKLLEQTVQLLLCQQPTQIKACGECKSCLLYRAGNHPDFYPIGQAGDKSIGVDEIRRLQQAMDKSANQNGNKIALITHAERLTVAAANALLKTLEEPPADSYLVLSSGRFDQLLPTIRSRLQFFIVHPPQLDELAVWLEKNLSMPVQATPALQVWLDKPLVALEHYRNSSDDKQKLLEVLSGQASPSAVKEEAAALRQLDEIEYFIRDLHWSLAGGPHNELIFTTLPESPFFHTIKQLKESGTLAAHCQRWRLGVRETRRQITGQSGINLQLLVHAIITDIQNTLGVFNVR